MRNRFTQCVIAIFAIAWVALVWKDRLDFAQRECVGYVVGKSRGTNGNRTAIAGYCPQLAKSVRLLCEDEYGLEIQTRMGEINSPIKMFDVSRNEYEGNDYGDRVRIRYKEHRVTHERRTIAVIALHERWNSSGENK